MKYLALLLLFFCFHAFARELKIDVAPGVERIQLQRTSNGINLYIGRKVNVTLTDTENVVAPSRNPSLLRDNTFEQLVIERLQVPVDWGDQYLASSMCVRNNMFENWVLLETPTKAPILVANDMMIGPFEMAYNNPTARLWLLPIGQHTHETLTTELSSKDAIHEYDQWQRQGKRTFLTFDLQGVKESYQDIKDLSALITGNNTGTCLGLSHRDHSYVMLKKDFSLNPINWSDNGSVLTGTFTLYAAAMLNDELLLVTASRDGELDSYHLPSTSPLSKAEHLAAFPPNRHYPEGAKISMIALAANQQVGILGILTRQGSQPSTDKTNAVQMAGQNYTLVFYAYNVATQQWKPKDAINLRGPVTDVSMSVDGNDLIFAYLTKEDGKNVCLLERTSVL